MKIILNATILSALFFSSGRAHNNKDLMEEMLNEVEKIEMELNQIKDEDNYHRHCYHTGCSAGGCHHGYRKVSSTFCTKGLFIWENEFCCGN
mmetsp:Transcript_6693/g.7354  ORF Transcript_6693/g.7354 Transcript_6693/m.7354 type:complete len:92 (+) Transcript_6693:96-371(+)|eukprot:CAMPEP_0194159706 /NCGR_PEP_ID=MMETSP0152-20130528/77985_1 /TAXON_ID=1049557 /ORGANISM="Thalassiothrix antarctica, Strain L6-D1" /LENGTH=91 /DNA_ID=CAMNT_0038869321 /DNA_START=63 /DNA_END=338 /DNA_ORIENTATION=+